MAEKKKLIGPVETKRALIEPAHPELSIRRQCDLLGLSRSSFYYEQAAEVEENLLLMRLIDAEYLKRPFYGSRKMTHYLGQQGHRVNRKRVQRLMRLMGIEAVYPKPRTSQGDAEHLIYPYLLRGVSITAPGQVWSSDITYVPVHRGFLYLVAIIDWFSRYVLSWRLSNTLDSSFCIMALGEALSTGRPEIFNTDQGCQFTSTAFTSVLSSAGVQISMDGRGRALDNVFIERLWRTVKYEDVYLRDYANGLELAEGLANYFGFYNNKRYHQSLDYRTPAQVHYGLT